MTQPEALRGQFDEANLINLLYEIDEGPVRDIFLDKVSIGSEASHDSAMQSVHDTAARIDELCEALGVGSGSWERSLLYGQFTRDGACSHSLERAAARRAQRLGQSIGEFMVEMAYESLPIESEPIEGASGVVLDVRCDTAHVLTLSVEGAYETIYGATDEDDSTMLFNFDYKANVDISSQKSA